MHHGATNAYYVECALSMKINANTSLPRVWYGPQDYKSKYLFYNSLVILKPSFKKVYETYVEYNFITQ